MVTGSVPVVYDVKIVSLRVVKEAIDFLHDKDIKVEKEYAFSSEAAEVIIAESGFLAVIVLCVLDTGS